MLPFIIIALASLLDGISTVWFLKKFPTSYETNPILGKRPSTLKIALVGLAWWVLWFVLLHYWHNGGVLALMIAGYHIKCAQNNFYIQF